MRRALRPDTTRLRCLTSSAPHAVQRYTRLFRAVIQKCRFFNPVASQILRINIASSCTYHSQSTLPSSKSFRKLTPTAPPFMSFTAALLLALLYSITTLAQEYIHSPPQAPRPALVPPKCTNGTCSVNTANVVNGTRFLSAHIDNTARWAVVPLVSENLRGQNHRYS